MRVPRIGKSGQIGTLATNITGGSGSVATVILSGAGTPPVVTGAPAIWTDTLTGNVYFRDTTGASVLIYHASFCATVTTTPGTPITVLHNLNSNCLIVQVWRNSLLAIDEVEIHRVGLNDITLDSNTAETYRVVVSV